VIEMTILETESTDFLPYRYRLLTNMLGMIMWWFDRDVRLTALASQLARQVAEVSDSDETYDGLIDAISDRMKLTPTDHSRHRHA
jgi:hypothetical protein